MRISISLILFCSMATLIACTNDTPPVQTSIQPAPINETKDTGIDLINLIKNSNLSRKDKDYLLDACALGIIDEKEKKEINDLNSNISLADVIKMMQNVIELK